MGQEDEDGGRTVRDAPASEQEAAPEREPAPRRILPSPSSAWGPSARGGRALVGRPDVGDAPSGGPSPALLPADPDDVEVALLGDADHAPPRRVRGPAPVLPPWARSVASAEVVAHRLDLAAEQDRPQPIPHLDPGGALVDHLRRWTEAVGRETGLGPLIEAPGPPPASAHAAAAELLARGQLALLAQPNAPRRAASTRLAAALGRLDDVELRVARAGTRVPRAAELLPVVSATEATSRDADPRWIRWWLDALAMPRGADLARLTPGPPPHAFDALLGDPDRRDRTLRHALALHGVDLARAALRLRVRAVGAHAVLHDGVGPEVANRVEGAVLDLDPTVDRLLADLRALGRGLHRAPHWTEARARDALTRVGTALDALTQALAEALAAATPLEPPPATASIAALEHPSVRAAVAGDPAPLARHPRPALAMLGRVLAGQRIAQDTLPASGLIALDVLQRVERVHDPEDVLSAGIRRAAMLGGGGAVLLMARWAPRS